jgi:cysteinyl-tRNA synthetase
MQAGATEDLDTSAIEAKIAARAEAKKTKNFAEADRIREELLSQGVVLEDTAQGTIWRSN